MGELFFYRLYPVLHICIFTYFKQRLLLRSSQRDILCDIAIWPNLGDFVIDILPSYFGLVPAGRTSIRHLAVHYPQDHNSTSMNVVPSAGYVRLSNKYG